LFNPPSDTPPRLRTVVESVQRHLRPSLAQEHYAAGKEAFDGKDYETALKEFTLVVDLTQETNDTAASAVSDVRVLAAGFRELSGRAIASAAPSSPRQTTVAETPVPAIEPPVAIRQNLPAIPQPMSQWQISLSGALDLVIDAHGDVKSVTLVQPIHPFYDGVLLSAAKRWKYRAATRNGEPVEFVKRLAITLDLRRSSENQGTPLR
jgi:hypothetical protein